MDLGAANAFVVLLVSIPSVDGNRGYFVGGRYGTGFKPAPYMTAQNTEPVRTFSEVKFFFLLLTPIRCL